MSIEFKQDLTEIKEIDWVTDQVKTELQWLQKEAFYKKDGEKVIYDLWTVKNYLSTLEGKSWQELSSKNSSAFMMAVQIALESFKDSSGNQLYDVGKVDGLYKAGGSTYQAVKKFQEDCKFKSQGKAEDGIPWKNTIQALISKLEGVSVDPVIPPASADQAPVNTPPKGSKLETAPTPVASVRLDASLKNNPRVPGVLKIGDYYVPVTQELIKQWTGEGYVTYDEAQKILEERQKIERQKLIKNPDQITTLTDDLIQDLFVEYKGRLSLNGLTSLTDKQAESLAEHQGWLLSLDGLTSLTDKQAESLAKHGGRLYLNGLTSLTDKQAESLAEHQGWLLSLYGLTSLTDKQAESLAKHGGRLYLNGLTSLTDKQAESLAKFQGSLLLPDHLKAKVDAYRTS